MGALARLGTTVLLIILVMAPAVPLAGAGSGAGATAGGDDGADKGEWVNSTAFISTSFGTIVATLADKDAPVTVGNFVMLADTHFYDNMRFHRIVKGFVIQTGDPNSRDNNPYNDGQGGSPQTIPLEISENLTHIDGALGMARSSDPNSASSQFYICDGAQHGLDGNYSVFGFTVQGIDVVRAIADVPVYGNKRPLLAEHPTEDVWLFSVQVQHGHYNATPGTGAAEPISGGGLFGAGAGPGAAAVLAVPVVVIVGGFLYLRWRRKRKGL